MKPSFPPSRGPEQSMPITLICFLSLNCAHDKSFTGKCDSKNVLYTSKVKEHLSDVPVVTWKKKNKIKKSSNMITHFLKGKPLFASLKMLIKMLIC